MAIRIHDPIDCVTCWAGVDHDEPDAEHKAIRIINLRIGHRAIMPLMTAKRRCKSRRNS